MQIWVATRVLDKWTVSFLQISVSKKFPGENLGYVLSIWHISVQEIRMSQRVKFQPVNESQIYINWTAFNLPFYHNTMLENSSPDKTDTSAFDMEKYASMFEQRRVLSSIMLATILKKKLCEKKRSHN